MLHSASGVALDLCKRHCRGHVLTSGLRCRRAFTRRARGLLCFSFSSRGWFFRWFGSTGLFVVLDLAPRQTTSVRDDGIIREFQRAPIESLVLLFEGVIRIFRDRCILELVRAHPRSLRPPAPGQPRLGCLWSQGWSWLYRRDGGCCCSYSSSFCFSGAFPRINDVSYIEVWTMLTGV